MAASLIRLALFQFLAVIYTILFVGLIVKLRFGSPAPQFFASYLRDYGALLLLAPTAWGIWGAIHLWRPRPKSGDQDIVFLSGMILLGALIFVSLLGTFSAFTYR